ncbi:NTP transferase domain-containing protein [Halovenus sp. WSH3]|uniref:NTP transferase domain-containing protein n=1 Tax=Halovenus carboxidivorans TaxID=2692199 RepID=A0A6B0T4A8_9EURY|nr:NDP-sugar synthase [Halovenus carboxidivorans]MXR50333.1 NTP transferase domain-containing protein [Halovenus carboxidivorans]
MEAVVLAGGYATRLWPITRHRPKMLLPVGERTVIDRILAELEDDDRIETVYLSTNERFADTFADHLADSPFEKPQLSVEETTEEDEKFGVIGALAQLVDREGIAGEDLLVVAGDNLISFDISAFLDFFAEERTPTLAAYDVGTPADASEYGVIDLDGDRVQSFEEKPDEPPSSLVSIACYAFPGEDVRFEEYLAGDNNPDEPGWFIQWLQSRRPVRAFTFDGAWFDIGTPEGYLDAVAWALDGENVIDPGATVENTELGTNVHIMDGARVSDSSLDRTLVFPDAVISESAFRESIIDCEAEVNGLDLAGALIGAHSELP